jgi:hypothetical protein
MRIPVSDKAKDRSLLRFGPQAFSSDVCSNATENVGAEDSKIKDTNHDDDENTHDDEELPAHRKAPEDVFPYMHAGPGPVDEWQMSEGYSITRLRPMLKTFRWLRLMPG